MKSYRQNHYLVPSLFLLSLLVLFSGCSNKTLKFCEEIVWRKFGKTAASQGNKKEVFQEVKEQCQPYKTPINQSAFLEGYEIGLTVFCQKGQGYAFGKAGKIYQKTCKPKDSKSFLSGYFAGRIFYLKEKQKEVKQLFRQSEDRVWRKEKDYLIESTQDLSRAEQELDLLESYREEAKLLALESKKIKLELVQLKKKQVELKFQ